MSARTTTEREEEKAWKAYERVEQDEGADDKLVVDVDGFEGPLDLLLDLARSQKVDITRISILALADQYLNYIEEARQLRLELAADYLVMAAWLAYLKSRLLIPEVDDGEEPTAAEMAAELAFRLKRLEAMRDAATRLANGNRLGRDVFARGAPEPIIVSKQTTYTTTLHDLLSAYAVQRQERAIAVVRLPTREVWSLQDARDALTRLIGRVAEWTPLSALMSPYLSSLGMRRSVTASAFGASLELVREGKLEIRQTEAFAPLYLRDHKPVAVVSAEPVNG